MKRAVAIGFLTWAAFAVAYYILLRGRIPFALGAAIGAGLFMAVVVGTYRISIDDLLNARRLSTDAPPRDGETVAATGPIRVDGEPLTSPFTRRAAAVYMYDVEHDTDRAIKDFSGLGLAPCYVDAFHGRVRIGGFPQLEAFEKQGDDSADARKAASAYVAATRFEDLTGFQFRATFDAVRHMVGDAVESTRKDWKLTNEGVTRHSRVVEQVVEPGEMVCLIGRYANGRVAPAEGVLPRLVRGAPGSAVASLKRKALGQFITATAIAIGLNFMVSLVFILPHAAAPARRKTSFDDMYKYHDAVRRGDLAAAQRMVADGIPVNVTDLERKPPLAIAGNDATAAWLIANGADVNAADEHGQTVLMEQATYGHAGIVKMLIAKGARLDDVEPRWKMSALRQAEQYQRMDVVQILRDAGAHDDAVTETNGTALAEDDPPVRVAVAYLDALFANDPKAMGALWTAGHQAFDEYDLGKWRGARPHPAHLVRGFANDAAATLELRGKTPDGGHVTWRYDLARVNGAWKLRDEVWETRFNGVE